MKQNLFEIFNRKKEEEAKHKKCDFIQYKLLENLKSFSSAPINVYHISGTKSICLLIYDILTVRTTILLL